MAVTMFPPPPLPHEPRINSPAIIGELTQRLSKTRSYSQSTLPVSGSSAEIPCDWLLKIKARLPPFGSNKHGVEYATTVLFRGVCQTVSPVLAPTAMIELLPLRGSGIGPSTNFGSS